MIEKGCDELVKLITPIDSNEKKIEIERQVIAKSGIKKKPLEGEQISVPKIVGDDPELSSAKSQLAAISLQCSKELDIKRKFLLNLCAELTDTGVIPTVSKKIRVKLDDLEQLAETSKAQVRNICDFIFLRMSALEVIKPFPKPWLDFELPTTKEAESLNLNQKFEHLNKLIRLDSSLLELSSATIDKYRDQLQHPLSLNLADAVRDIDLKLAQMVRYDDIYTKLLDAVKYLSAVSMDAEWIATDDLRMDEYWPSIALINLEKSPLMI
ncbi:hypothetical protein [Pseudomonas sp. NMS19W]|uniref:hypothetical protein n=1 Tax=Pseudomonas sp. NMS19W TaxID=3079768 RepID=UPI003F65AF7C